MIPSDADLRDLEFAYQCSERTWIENARRNLACFISYVMRDEETGKPVDVEQFQIGWHRIADRYDRWIIWSFAESGKSFQLSIARTLWELGRDPSLRFAIVSGNEEKAAKIGNTIADYIEGSEELHRVFPGLVPHPSRPWNTRSFSVQRQTLSKDPSVQIVGTGSDIQGARVDRALLDDVLNRDNTRTDHMRKETRDWYLKTFPGRMTARGRVGMIGNAFHPDDLLHWMARNPRFKAFKYPILDKDGRSAWPARWPLSRIEERRQELGPLESSSQLMCTPIDDAIARFKRDYMDLCKTRGNGIDLAYAIRGVPPGCKVYTGVDLGIKRTEKNALTTFFTLLVHPNGDRQPLWIESGRYLASEIKEMVIQWYARFHCIFIVENNGGQDFLVQDLQVGSAVPVVPFTTGKNKVDPRFGVEAMSAQFAAGKWIIPNRAGLCHPEVQQWVDDLLGYNPCSHTADRIMAAWLSPGLPSTKKATVWVGVRATMTVF